MAKRIRLKGNYLARIREFMDLLNQKDVKFSRVILFGSYARGRPTPDSDIDLAVISDRFGKNTAKEMMFLRKIALKVDSRIEPIPLSSEDLNDRYSALVQEIKHNGREIAGKKGF